MESKEDVVILLKQDNSLYCTFII